MGISHIQERGFFGEQMTADPECRLLYKNYFHNMIFQGLFPVRYYRKHKDYTYSTEVTMS